MMELADKRCKACEGGVSPLAIAEARELLGQLSGWTLDQAGRVLSKTYTFKNYYQTMSFVNAMAWIAHREDHHPELLVSWRQCVVHYTTHAIGGLSENDFICAAKVDALIPSP